MAIHTRIIDYITRIIDYIISSHYEFWNFVNIVKRTLREDKLWLIALIPRPQNKK